MKPLSQAVRSMLMPALLLAGLHAAPAFAQAGAPLPIVARVDLTRYAGAWYEIAKLPNIFQRQCLGDVSATYTPLPEGGVQVLNRCRISASGEPRFDTATGMARPLDASNAKLQVSFLPALLRWLPVGWGDYQVIELDPEYRWVMVGEPGRRYLWVLARSTTLPPGVYEGLLKRAAELGFPVDQMVITPQGS